MTNDKIIALLWDFDKTLISGYMQTPLFEHYGVDPVHFWDEVNALPKFHSEESGLLVSESLYLNHILTYVRKGVFAGLDNALLRHLGGLQHLAPGVPEIFGLIDQFAAGLKDIHGGNIQLEHYVISTGLRQIVMGSRVAPYMRYIWGCEFLDREGPPGLLAVEEGKPPVGQICDIGYVMDHTTKTRAIFEINKGVREGLGIDVDTSIPRSQRRVPFENMIYIADGPSDIPSLSVIKQFGGKTFGVYLTDSPRDLTQANLLLEQGRVDCIGPADYRQGTNTTNWLLSTIAEIAHRLSRNPPVNARTTDIAPTPRHFHG